MKRRGYVWERLGKTDFAEQDYRLAVQLDDADAMFNLALLLERQQQYAEAAGFCEKLIAKGQHVSRAEALRNKLERQLVGGSSPDE
ncbi:hypothetical protein [Rhodopirellula sp. MGV]|uniref:hypothetical protein n=1 Tax=Rhodopirellula sp. MGV TaxID=2023130 RepID=UPI000B975397|nr:hypothetical protein [Rhodopirellula sp. MGV]OYP32325.1 hypothetical protein CGZ80_19860 [Rhodopirellula sp. MGV]PNY35891.1 hypothetical protein C2E31_15625 [Rhodopirellula baltica]